MNQDRLPDALFEEPLVRAAVGRRTGGASVTLRDQGDQGDDPASLMDPAAKSLADALRITFRLLQLSMFVLLVLFFFSGSESVNQGERGIRVVLGKPVDSNLTPGFRWSLPYPLGEIVKIPQSSPSIAMDDAFWPFLAANDRGKSSTELASMGGPNSLSPERDGSLLTAEGYLAHIRCVVRYRRNDPGQVHGSINPADEARIVQAAVKRGMIHAAAVLSLDEIMKDAPDAGKDAGQFVAAETIAKAVAESTLAAMNSGISIDSLSLIDRMPPQNVARDYHKPQEAQSAATAAVENALEFRRNELTTVAGEAADLILSQIDLYEQQLKVGDTAEAEQTHARIDALLLGERVQIDGAVPSLLAGARQYRSTIVSSVRGDAERFRSIRESYRTNPQVVLHREWSEALKTFITRPGVQVQFLPPGERWVIQINRDPAINREDELRRGLERNEQLRQDRERLRSEERFRRADPSRQRVTSD